MEQTLPALSDQRLPPELETRGLLGHWSELRKNSMALFAKAVATHGDVVRLRVGRYYVILVRNPAYVKYVLQDQQKHFSKQTRGYAVLRRLLGNGLVTSEGEFWLRQRRIAQPGFHKQRIAHFAETMTTLTG